MQGTVPYLGTFLTDLTMLDTALQDYIEVGSLSVATSSLLLGCMEKFVSLSIYLEPIMHMAVGWAVGEQTKPNTRRCQK